MDWLQFGFNNKLLNDLSGYSPQDQNTIFNALKQNPNLANQLKLGNESINNILVDWGETNNAGSILGNNGGNSIFNGIFGTDNNGDSRFFGMKGVENAKTGQMEYAGATPFQWGMGALGAASTLYGMWQGNKQLKLAKANFEEQKALQRANYENQAKAYNNSLRNQQSGRSFSGMSGSAKRTLGREYDARKVRESYA